MNIGSRHRETIAQGSTDLEIEITIWQGPHLQLNRIYDQIGPPRRMATAVAVDHTLNSV